MKPIVLKPLFSFALLVLVFLGHAQVRLIEHKEKEPDRKAAAPMALKDTLRIDGRMLIERKKDPGHYARPVQNGPMENPGWQPMAIGAPKRSLPETDSARVARQTPYHLLPLLREKGHVQNAASSRWQPPVSKEGG